MTSTNKLVLLVTGVFLLASGAANAQDSASDEADVWATIEGQWEAAEKGNNEWMDELLSDDFSGWGSGSPAPRSKSSTRMWDDFNNSQSKTLEHELYPLAIVVHADVAVAHYFYTIAVEDKDDKVEVKNGRYTDVLIRTEEGWKFIAWHGGEDD
jgi:hypothetical protein